MLHYFCPRCYSPSRPVAVILPGRRKQRRRTQEEHEAWLNKPKTCTRCTFTGANRDFPLVMGRGELTARSWCKSCANKYRAARHRAAKLEKAQMKGVA